MTTKTDPVNHLNPDFCTTPKLARQVMTYKSWQQTALATQCKVISMGETWDLRAKHLGGGMYEVRAYPTYWTTGKPSEHKPVVKRA